MNVGDIIAVEVGWYRSFVFLPTRTVSNRWVWGRCYKRIVWIYTGFADEPYAQYGSLFDVLKDE